VDNLWRNTTASAWDSIRLGAVISSLRGGRGFFTSDDITMPSKCSQALAVVLSKTPLSCKWTARTHFKVCCFQL